MKISMILTSLIVAMSAAGLTACDNTGKPEVKDQAAEVIKKSEEMKDEATDAVQPEAPKE